MGPYLNKLLSEHYYVPMSGSGYCVSFVYINVLNPWVWRYDPRIGWSGLWPDPGEVLLCILSSFKIWISMKSISIHFFLLVKYYCTCRVDFEIRWIHIYLINNFKAGWALNMMINWELNVVKRENFKVQQNPRIFFFLIIIMQINYFIASILILVKRGNC